MALHWEIYLLKLVQNLLFSGTVAGAYTKMMSVSSLSSVFMAIAMNLLDMSIILVECIISLLTNVRTPLLLMTLLALLAAALSAFS